MNVIIVDDTLYINLGSCNPHDRIILAQVFTLSTCLIQIAPWLAYIVCRVSNHKFDSYDSNFVSCIKPSWCFRLILVYLTICTVSVDSCLSITLLRFIYVTTFIGINPVKIHNYFHTADF